jgi:EAL domain-containing protein (putative c-di-GMP-specific phosphodiesterase class I)
VENLQQYHLLKEQGCDVAQGYLFSRPIHGIAIEEWLANFKIQNFV